MAAHVSPGGTTPRLENLALVLSALATAAMLGWLLYYCAYGISLTDETFYLFLLKAPWERQPNVVHFHFVLHPLYRLLDGDIVALRRANVLLTFGLGLVLASFAIPRRRENNGAPWARAIALCAFATIALTTFAFWLVTPSYNSLVLQAALLMMAGMVLLDDDRDARRSIGAVVAGVAGWLAFMSKPTSGAAFVAVIFGYAVLTRVRSLRLWCIALGVPIGLLIASGLVIDGSLTEFARRYFDAYERDTAYGMGHDFWSIVRIDRLRPSMLEAAAALTATLCIAWTLMRQRSSAALILACASAIAALGVIAGILPRDIPQSLYRVVLVWPLLFGPLLVVASRVFRKEARLPSLREIATPLCGIVLPAAVVFGTNNNYWTVSIYGSILWALAGVIALRRADALHARSALLPAAMYAQLITVVVLTGAMHDPYRQPGPLRDNTERVQFGSRGSALILDSTFAAYLRDVQRATADAGFSPGTRLLDLSGYSPGALYAIDAKPLGLAWTLGGHNGSQEALAIALENEPCQAIHAAWILDEPGGPQQISSQVLQPYGLDLTRDYDRVAEFHSPQQWNRPGQTQYLYKPKGTGQGCDAKGIEPDSGHGG